MKMSGVFLVLGFILIMALWSDSTPQAHSRSRSCCSSFFHGKIPPKFIVRVEKTAERCAEPGFVVVTPRHKLCVRKVSANGK